MNPNDRKSFQLDHERLRADWNRLGELTQMDTQRYRTQMVRDMQAFNTAHRKSMDEFRAQMDQFRQSITSMRFTLSKDDRRRNDEHTHRSYVFHLTFISAFIVVGFSLAAWLVFR